jgi:hypothetical protein
VSAERHIAESVDLTLILSGTERERDVALYRICEDVLRCLESSYLPPREPPRMIGLAGLSVEELRDKCDKDPKFAYGFGVFRDSVLNYEGDAARRLETLRSTARTLERLLVKSTDRERVQSMLYRLGEFMAARWRCDLDLSGGRDWSLRMVRRYDLLPVAWRYL